MAILSFFLSSANGAKCPLRMNKSSIIPLLILVRSFVMYKPIALKHLKPLKNAPKREEIRFVSMLRESLYLLSPALYTITDDEFKEE